MNPWKQFGKAIPSRLRFRQRRKLRRQQWAQHQEDLNRLLTRVERENLRREAENTSLKAELARCSDAIRWLSEHAGLTDVPPAESQGPLVSIIMPVRNRAAKVGSAIRSIVAQTHRNWELLVVDDGSTDETSNVLRQFCDPRITLIEQSASGVAVARNRGLQAARGELVAYLDSDNTWYPGYLQAVVETFGRHAEADSAYAAQLVENRRTGQNYLRATSWDRERFLEHAGIDLNAFSHRRSLFESAGGFDESLTRLVDWDLIARYTAVSDPVPVPSVAGRYFESEPDSISAGENFGRNWYLIQRKHERPIRQPLRVLYVVANYPQLTETYIRWEITRMQRWGVHVDVWSPTNRVGAPYDPEVPGHFGPLEEAIEQTRPHVAHIHWLHFATSVRDTLAHRGIPITVRGHGYDFNPALLRQLAKDPAIQSVYVFPHFARQVPPHPKIKATPVAVCGDLYYPEPKDRRLVVRAGTTKRAKDLEMMVDVALRCREHRFLLIGSTPIGLESDRDHLLRYNEERGNPVEIRLNVPTEETAAIIRRAGIYLHTYGETEPFGMSVSIGEAMATGALTLVRNRPGAREYIGDAGRLYGSAEEAANIIWATAKFSPREWAEIERKAVDRAYLEFADCKVLRPILDQWLQQSEVRLDWTAMPGFDDDMELKRWIPVLLQRMQADRRGFHDNSYLAHLLGMYRYLKSWGWDPDVCLGSLFHSIYLPGHPFWPLEARDEVRALIGRRAEQIAYLHSAHRIDQFAAAVERGEPFEVEDRFTKRMTPMTCEEFREFAALMLADWLENVIRHPEEMNWQTSFIHVATMLGGAALESTGKVLRILNQPPALNPSHELQRAA